VSVETIYPNFFICGAAKSGTTSLWMYLKQHPNIFMPEDIRAKEPAYFCRVNGSWGYEGQEERYSKLFEAAGMCKAVGEASTTYLTYPESAAWIHSEIPEAKIIIILRDPVSRAYSLYRWMVNHGHEWVSTFEKALEVELERKSDPAFFTGNAHTFYDYLYFESGMYSEQLARYFTAFPRQHIKVILLDELKKMPVETTQEIYRFLGVDTHFKPLVSVHNKAELRPVFIRFHFALNEFQRRHRLTRKAHLSKVLFDKNRTLLKLKWPKINPQTDQMLREKYRNDIQKTQKMIQKDLSGWLV